MCCVIYMYTHLHHACIQELSNVCIYTHVCVDMLHALMCISHVCVSHGIGLILVCMCHAGGGMLRPWIQSTLNAAPVWYICVVTAAAASPQAASDVQPDLRGSPCSDICIWAHPLCSHDWSLGWLRPLLEAPDVSSAL